jgi:hypothetical protein
MLRYRIDRSVEGTTVVMVRLFDDGLVLSAPIGPLPGADINAAGAIGAAIKGAKAAKEAPRQQALGQAEAAGYRTAHELAAALGRYAHVIPLPQVASVRLEKGFGRTRRLVVHLVDGTRRRFRFGDEKHPSAQVAQAFGGVLGDRFVNTLRKS